MKRGKDIGNINVNYQIQQGQLKADSTQNLTEKNNYGIITLLLLKEGTI